MGAGDKNPHPSFTSLPHVYEKCFRFRLLKSQMLPSLLPLPESFFKVLPLPQKFYHFLTMIAPPKISNIF